MNQYIKENLEWIQSGKIGCTFATLFSKNPESIGWMFSIYNEEYKFHIPDDAMLLSVVFPDKNISFVKNWCLLNGFYIEEIDNELSGLRYKMKEGISWVQYFGEDSHVKTRKAPHSMITMCCRLPVKQYVKVGFNGILHIAHAGVHAISDYVSDKLWSSSFKNTEKQIGHKPTIREAAKTTFYEK